MDVTKSRSQHQIKNGDIILTYIGMLCMGKPYFEAVHEMDDIGDSLRETILNENVELLISNKIHPTALPNGMDGLIWPNNTAKTSQRPETVKPYMSEVTGKMLAVSNFIKSLHCAPDMRSLSVPWTNTVRFF